MRNKKNWVRLIAVLLGMTLLAGLFSGCGNDNEPKEEGVKKLKVGIPRSAVVTDYYDNSFTAYIEEQLGAEIEFELFSNASEALNQLSLMCAANEELPDVLVGFSTMSGSVMFNYGEEGFFIDMKDLIEKYGQEFKAHMAELPKEEYDRVMDFITQPETGAIYGLPTYSAVVTSDYMQNQMLINTQWLAAVGMEAPKTVDELYDVLVAFRDEDPNGNGKADELPMLSPSIYYYVINAYLYYDSKNPFNITDGKVWSPTVSDEYREALSFLCKLYDEGLIKFDIPAADAKNTISGNGTTARVGIWCGSPTSDINYSNKVLDQYDILEPLSDATGKGGYLVERPKDLLITGHITKDCKDPDLAMQFLDLCFNDGVVTRRRHGEEGTYWVWEEEAKPNRFGAMSHIHILNADIFSPNNVTWGSLLPSIYTDYNYLTMSASTSGTDAEIGRIYGAQTVLAESFRKPEETVVNLKLTLSERHERENISGKIFTTAQQYFSLFLSGKLDPANDDDWNKYKNEMEACGLSRLIEIYQNAYDRQ